MATPRSIAAATQLLERYADLTLRLDLVEADRADAIATANARADNAAAPMLKELGDIAAVIGDWWPKGGVGLLTAKNKSVQLGGCIIGTRQARAKLTHTFESDDKAAAALAASRYAKHTTKTKVTLDRTATLKLLQVGGKTAANIKELGFKIEPGSDQFFIERVQQDRTISQ